VEVCVSHLFTATCQALYDKYVPVIDKLLSSSRPGVGAMLSTPSVVVQGSHSPRGGIASPRASGVVSPRTSQGPALLSTASAVSPRANAATSPRTSQGLVSSAVASPPAPSTSPRARK
jgi:hypothetical protein